MLELKFIDAMGKEHVFPTMEYRKYKLMSEEMKGCGQIFPCYFSKKYVFVHRGGVDYSCVPRKEFFDYFTKVDAKS